MKLKKIFTIALMILVTLSLGASYLFAGLTPRQKAPEPTEPTTYNPPTSVAPFTAPTTAPFVKGPTSPPPQ